MSLATKKCVPCKKGENALSIKEVDEMLSGLSEWQADDKKSQIYKEYKFKNYADSLSFVNAVSEIAEAENHHPDISFGWGYCKIYLSTHSIGGLHQNDFIMAAKIDEVL